MGKDVGRPGREEMSKRRLPLRRARAHILFPVQRNARFSDDGRCRGTLGISGAAGNGEG
jgi:hypothetical protein